MVVAPWRMPSISLRVISTQLRSCDSTQSCANADRDRYPSERIAAASRDREPLADLWVEGAADAWPVALLVPAHCDGA
jgi:hypothetical protein